jgi:hypothetical protein
MVCPRDLAALLLHATTAHAASLSAWVLTDIHIDNEYKAGTDPQTNCKTGVGSASAFGDYACDTPMSMLSSSLAAMAEIKPDVDFIFWLGDQTPYIASGRSTAMIVEGAANLTAAIVHQFPKAQLVPVLGNHDTFPVDQMLPPGLDPDGASARVLPLWKRWLSADAQKTFAHGGYYQLAPRAGLRLVVLNNAMWLAGNKRVVNITDPGDHLAWIDRTLAAAQAAGERVWLLGHVPVGGAAAPDDPAKITPASPGPVFTEAYNRAFTALLVRYAPVIDVQVYGHVHDDTFRVLTTPDEAATPVGVQLCAPSLTTWTEENPRFRLLSFGSEGEGAAAGDFALSTYKQYFTNITADAAAGAVSWRLEYEAMQEYAKYGLDAAGSAAGWARVAQSMATDAGAFDTYWAHYHGRGQELSCDSACKRLQLCRVRVADLSGFLKCIR